jgi:hypothetical protein
MRARPHGTRARYVFEGCRCVPCRQANAAYATERDRRKVYPEVYGPLHTTVPADEVRQHLRALQAAGMGQRAIALAAGVRRALIRDLLFGRVRSDALPTMRLRPGQRRYVVKRLRRDKAEALLALAIPDCARPHQLVDAAPTWRRLNELLEIGWTKSRLARALGSRAQVPALQIRPDQVFRSTETKVEALYVAAFRALKQATPEEQRETEAERQRARGGAA